MRVAKFNLLSHLTKHGTADDGVVGHVDHLDLDGMSGWVADKTRATTRLSLELLIDGRCAERIEASLFRPDLKELGISDGYSGFRCVFPAECFDNKRHKIALREADSGKLLTKPNLSLNFPDKLAEPMLLGLFEQISEDFVVSGWAWLSGRESPPTLDVYVNDVKIKSQRPDLRRADLKEVGLETRPAGFRIALPKGAIDKVQSIVSIKVGEQLLPGSPKALTLEGDTAAAVFRSRSQTPLFDAAIDFSWPYYISGTVMPKKGIVPDHLDVVSGRTRLATVPVSQNLDVASPSYGTCYFSWRVPAALTVVDHESIALRVPGCGDIDFAVQEADAGGITGGGFCLDGNTVRGHVQTDPPQQTGTVSLRVVVGERMAKIAVPLDAAGRGRFAYEMPLDCTTGEEYLVGVCGDADRRPLPAPDGDILFPYRARAVGKVDAWNPPTLTGWAVDFEAGDRKAVVQLYDGARLVAEATCARPRDDVAAVIGHGGSHGFLLHLPASLYDGTLHNFRLTCAGIELKWNPAAVVPSVLDGAALAAIDPGRRIWGRVEQLSTTFVAGWAWDCMRPEAPASLVIRVDGQAVGTTLANQFSARLRGDGRDGQQIFLFHLPASLQNGAKRYVTVEEANTHFALANTVSPISFPLIGLPETEASPDRSDRYRLLGETEDREGYRRYALPEAVRQPEPRPMLSLIALNWNGGALLDDFFASLTQHPPRQPYELLFVDHGSSDDSLAIVRRYSDRLPIRCLERQANYSYAASNNLAAQLAKGEYLLFVNNDLVFTHDCADSLARFLADPEVGAVGARLLEPLRDATGRWRLTPHHEGVRFKIDALPQTGTRYYAPQEISDVPVAFEKCALWMPVVTAALMLCRKSDFLAVGGFCQQYYYGLEDVDLCLKISRQLGKQIVCDLDSCAIHNRSATRGAKTESKQKTAFYTADIHARNRAAYIRRCSRILKREILRALIDGSTYYRSQRLRVTFAVTEADRNTPAGDYFTALELGAWLREKFGWEIFFVIVGTYLVPDTDVLVVMRHDYNIRNIKGANPGLVTVAWIRNRTDQWLARAEFPDYNIVFASSQKIVDHVRAEAHREAVLLPIATNPQRFSPDMVDPAYASDLVFTGNYHKAVRGAVAMLDLVGADYDFAIYGHNWGNHPDLKPYWRGSLPYSLLGKAYASSRLVLDDSHPVTREWDSLNSRVFDAIASGKVVLTNCVDGAKSLFGDRLPTFSNWEELNTAVRTLLADDAKREGLARELREIVLARHTYANRAETFRDTVRAFLGGNRLRFAIKIGVPRQDELEQWGDYHFALAVKRALERQGHFARIDILPQWESGLTASDDVVIVLRGLSRYKPEPTTVNIMWLISHSDDVTLTEMREYDHVFVASNPYAARLAPQLGDRISPLLQCTDPELFHPDPDSDLALPEALFVGNSRGQRREVVRYALEGGLDFGVYGTGWDGLLPAERILGEHIPNATLRRYYSSARVVLNDHWPDMRAEGFISNRVFDVGACGGILLSDAVKSMSELFDASIPTYDSADSFLQAVRTIRQDPDAYRQRALELSGIIRANHTFDQRVAKILQVVDSCERQAHDTLPGTEA